ncbi:MAG TPA: PRC-barrel domain-containing protein [Gemmatimonadaceae bacterium]|nr:PRC-barrel domain-containing protein [Gemmatimonadaceae bacterium]
MTKQDPRRARDAAGIGPYARERERLVPLSDLNGWNVVGGEPDIRSWEVKTLSGRHLGSVRELLVDPDGGEVVMLDVDLSGTDKHAFVPIRVVEIDRARRVIRADSGDLEEHAAAEGAAARDYSAVRRDVRYADAPGDASDERVVEQRPIVEETVVRRRPLEEPDVQP